MKFDDVPLGCTCFQFTDVDADEDYDYHRQGDTEQQFGGNTSSGGIWTQQQNIANELTEKRGNRPLLNTRDEQVRFA